MESEMEVALIVSESEINKTIFETPELLSDKQLKKLEKKMPYFAQKSIQKARDGLLFPVTHDQLLERRKNYLESKNESDDKYKQQTIISDPIDQIRKTKK